MNLGRKHIAPLLIIGMMLFSSALSAQKYSSFNKSKIDSIAIYQSEALRTEASSPVVATRQLELALEFAIKKSDPRIATCYQLLAECLKRHQYYASAEEKFLKAVKEYKRGSKYESTNSDLYKCYMQLAEIQRKQLKYNQAKENAHTASTISQGPDQHNALRLEYAIIASQLPSDQTKAGSEIYQRLEQLAIEEHNTGDIAGEALTNIEIGELNERLGNSTEAINNYEDAKRLSEPLNNNSLSNDVTKKLAEAYHNEGFYSQEIEVRNSNIATNAFNNNEKAVALQNLEVGNALIADKKFEEAEGYLTKGLETVVGSTNHTNIQPIKFKSTELQIGADAYKKLADQYFKINDYQKALSYYQRYAVLQDSVKAAHDAELKQAVALSESININRDRIAALEHERELSDLSIQGLQKEKKEQSEQLSTRNLVIAAMAFGFLLLVATGFFLYRSTRARQKADKLLALQSLSGQMNPHFIFNALNSVNEYISQNDERAANRYLSSFSKLMRRVMDDSRHTFIPLQEETEMLGLYLQLEHSRFKDKFDYTVDISEQAQSGEWTLPPMLIQPYLENAVWHGLRYREGKGHLSLNIDVENNALHIQICDDGIGVEKSKQLKTQNQKKQHSLGMRNIETRMALLNEIYSTEIKVDISEAYPGAEFPGVLVKIVVPQHLQEKA